mgnify:CR=1 FL=1
MIKRHAPSFLFSAIVHILVIVAIVYTYEYVVYLKKNNTEERVCVNLCQGPPSVPKPLETKIEPKKIEPKKSEPKKIEAKTITKKESIVKETPQKKKIVDKVVKTSEIIPAAAKAIEDVEKEEIPKEENPIDMEQTEEINTTKINVPEVQKEKYVNNNLQKIARLLSNNLYYPRNARKRGIVGKVVVKFKLSTSATVSEIEVVSSNSETLSRAATKTIEDLSGKFPKPSQELILKIPIEYSLTQK